jgi:hypothetical protein
MIRERNIATCIILSIVTCGIIYPIIWFISITDDVALASGDSSISGGKAFLFTLLTCGYIYPIYWSYQMGKKIYEAKLNKGENASDNSVLYLVLSILGLGLVNYCLIQTDLNEMAEA